MFISTIIILPWIRLLILGCDSIVTLNLTINKSYATDVQMACDSFIWIDGNTYTASNNSAQHILTNSLGCDSVVTLDLTINNSSQVTDVQVACESYKWINGVTYTSSNDSAHMCYLALLVVIQLSCLI